MYRKISISFLFVALCALQAFAWKLNRPTAGAFKKMASSAIAAAGLSLSPIQPSHAIGPVDLSIDIQSYKPVELCNGQKPIMPGQKAMLGLFPVCLQVEAIVNNPEKSKTLNDVSVYGFVKENLAGNSVLPNNPDFATDAGQYAMIKTVPPGENKLTYEFVIAISQDPKKEAVPPISFLKTRGKSFPDSNKFKALDICEIDFRADGCPGAEDDE